MLRKHRMVTTTVSGAILGYCGDLVTQSATTMQTEEGYDSRRGLTFTLFGGYITGPLNYMWLGWLDKRVQSWAPMGGLRAVALKVSMQSFIMQPLLYVPNFFLFNALARGWTFDGTVERVKSDYFRTVRTIWVVWTPLVIFAFVALPMHQQAIFFSGFGLVWNSILSFISNRPAIKEGAAGTLETLRERADVSLSDIRSIASRMVTNVRDVPDPPRKVHGPSPGSIVGYLMGPGLQ